MFLCAIKAIVGITKLENLKRSLLSHIRAIIMGQITV